MKTRNTFLIVLLTLVSAVTAAPQPELFGIGALIRDGGTKGPIIHDIVPNSPAAKAKLSTGLIISKVDDTPTAGKRLDECVSLIRGAAGTTVRIELTDPADGKKTHVTLTRDMLESAKKAQLPETAKDQGGAVGIGFGSPQAIDGQKAAGEWASAHQADIPIVLPDHTQATARLYLMNDRTNLYVAFEFGLADGAVRQSFSYSIAAENAASLFEEGTDFGFLGFEPTEDSSYYDGVRSSRPPSPTGQQGAGQDTNWGGHNDGSGRYARTNNVCFYEFSKPLSTEDPQNDVQLQPGKCYSFGIDLRLLDPKLTMGSKYPEGYGDTDYPPRGEKMLIRIAIPQ